MNLSPSQLLLTAKHLIKHQNLLLEVKTWEGILNLRSVKISQGSRGRGHGMDGIYTMSPEKLKKSKHLGGKNVGPNLSLELHVTDQPCLSISGIKTS